MDAIKGIIGVLLVTGVILVPQIQKLGETGGDLTQKSLLGTIDSQTNLIKIATKGDDRIKNTVRTILEMGSLKTYQRALYPNILTADDIASLTQFFEDETSDASFISDVFPHCQKWLIFAEPGQTKFRVTPDVLEAYHSSLTSEHISSLKPAAKVSEALYNKATQVNNFCGATCTSTVTCGECWKLRQDYLQAQNNGNLDQVIEVDTEIRENGCASACGDVCTSVFNSLSLISSTSFLGVDLEQTDEVADSQAKIDFIDLGIGLP